MKKVFLSSVSWIDNVMCKICLVWNTDDRRLYIAPCGIRAEWSSHPISYVKIPDRKRRLSTSVFYRHCWIFGPNFLFLVIFYFCSGYELHPFSEHRVSADKPQKFSQKAREVPYFCWRVLCVGILYGFEIIMISIEQATIIAVHDP